MFEKLKTLDKRTGIVIGVVSLLVVVLVALLVGFLLSSSKKEVDNTPKNVAPHVDGKIASDQVNSFYQQYISPQTPNKRKLVQLAGTENLLFYYDYYQHGFDPIVCSAVMPTKVAAALGVTGTTAIVNVTATYPDATTQVIAVRVIFDKGVDIDAVKCPGQKGALSPGVKL